MKLEEMMSKIKHTFYVEDELRAYIYNDCIEIIDYMEVEGLKPIYGNLICITYNKDNQITCISHDSLILLNKNNIHLYQLLIELINITIEDLSEFKCLDDSLKNSDITKITQYEKI